MQLTLQILTNLGINIFMIYLNYIKNSVLRNGKVAANVDIEIFNKKFFQYQGWTLMSTFICIGYLQGRLDLKENFPLNALYVAEQALDDVTKNKKVKIEYFIDQY